MVDHVALVAVLDGGARTGWSAVGRFVRDRTAGRATAAEIAVIVCDALQGRGLGRALGLALADQRAGARHPALHRHDAARERARPSRCSGRSPAALHQNVHIEVHHGVRELVTDLAA